MDETPKATLSLVVTTTMVNHSVLGILIDDRSSCNLMYLKIFKELMLHLQDLKPYEGRSLLAFNNFSTQPCGEMNLSISFGEGKNMRNVNVFFLVLPCESVYNDILRRWFVLTLDIIASTVHLKKYHNDFGKPALF